MSVYGVFINKKTKKRLVYYPVPKNANSSVKLFFARHIGLDHHYLFLGDSKPLYKIKKTDFGDKKNLVDFLPVKQKFTEINADIKCCVVRDPVDRFLSAYKNRILYHKDKSFGKFSVDQILEQMLQNNFTNKHFLPQTYFLGNSLDYYNFAIDVKNILYFAEKINNFFGKKISFPRIQTGGNKYDVQLTSDQIKKIRKIYKSDYSLIKNNLN